LTELLTISDDQGKVEKVGYDKWTMKETYLHTTGEGRRKEGRKEGR
jgi:phosphopantetheinyl transferase